MGQKYPGKASEEQMPVLHVLQRATPVFCDEASEEEKTQ